MKQNMLIKPLLLVALIGLTTVTFGDGGGPNFEYCNKNKYFDVVMVKFPYKTLKIRSLKVNGTPSPVSSMPTINGYQFLEVEQLFQWPNQTFDGIGKVSLKGYEFVK